MPPFRPARLSRRSFLAGVGVTAVAAACSSATRTQQSGRHVVVANHPVYIDSATNPGFERATGIHVEYHEEINDDGAWLASVTPQLSRGESIDRDVVIVSEWVAHRLGERGYLTPDGSDGGSPAVWGMGAIGVAYDRKALGDDVHRMAELFQPPLHARVALPVDMRVSLGIALLADRVDPSTATLDQATATAARLANSVALGQVRLFDHARPIDELVNGTVTAAVVAASDTIGLERDHPDIRFVVPEEGGLLLTDVAAVPLGAPDPDAARSYIDYATRAEVAAERFRAVPVLWPAGPVDDRLRRNAREIYADARRNPPPDVRARLRPFRFLDESEDQAFTALFDGVVHAVR
jgi:spermidine/putrescine transport system substrate-binding protein